jgi:hypothetical protein
VSSAFERPRLFDATLLMMLEDSVSIDRDASCCRRLARVPILLFGQSSPRIAAERPPSRRAPRLFMLRNGQRAKNLSDFLPNTTTDLSRVYASLSLPGLRDVRVGNPVPARSTQTPKHERHSTGEKSHSHIVTRRATPQHATGRLPSRPWLLARRRASHHTHAQLAPPIHHNSFQRVCSSLLREQTSTSNAVRAGPRRER